MIASPVYYASTNATLIACLDRLFYSTSFDKTMKVGASVAVARRGGCSATFDQLNKYFTISGMPVASSQYWNSVHGQMPGYTPDKIIVVLGTNQYGDETMTAVEEYYERLMEIYGNEIPVLCTTPIWRGDNLEGLPTLERYCDNIEKIARSYKNVKVVNGMKLVPHMSEYFLDNLHPNCHGCEVYGRRLVEEIRKLDF